jgi:hypothetical protein
VGLCAPFFAAFFAVVLTPTSALADANPNNHGHHYHLGWVNHHSPPAPAPAPKPGGGPATTGPKNSIVAVVQAAGKPQASTLNPETPFVAPPAGLVTTAQPAPAVRNLWLVAILLATVLAANVTLAVMAASRGGHYAIVRTFAPVGIRV